MKLLLTYLLLLLFFHSFASTPIGFLDTAHPTNGITGWALDQNSSSSSLVIHFYANAPAGSAGSVFIGSTIANQPRPDVNSATGYSGNHGFYWIMPFNLVTPCPIDIYAYAIDPHGVNNKLLNNSPKSMPLVEGSIANIAGNSTIRISANSQFGGAIYSLSWDGVEFINRSDHGRLLQSAASFYSSWNPQSWTAECYNPTEAGADVDGSSICTTSKLISFSIANNILETSTQMAFYGSPSNPAPSCPNPSNTTSISDYIFEKKVTIGTPVSAHAIKYEVTFKVPSNETRLSMGQFEVLTGYLNKTNSSASSSFNKVYYYNQNDQTLTYNSASDFSSLKPVVISSSDGSHAMGIYSPDVKINDIGGYYSHNIFGDCSKWNFVKRIENIQPGESYKFTGYVCVGSLENVRVTLAQIISAYPNL